MITEVNVKEHLPMLYHRLLELAVLAGMEAGGIKADSFRIYKLFATTSIEPEIRSHPLLKIFGSTSLKHADSTPSIHIHS